MSAAEFAHREPRGTLGTREVGDLLLQVRALLTGVIVATASLFPNFAQRDGTYLLVLLALPTFSKAKVGVSGAAWVAFAALMLVSGEFVTGDVAVAHNAAHNELFFALMFVALRVIVADRRAMVIALYGYLIGAVYTMYYVLQRNGHAQLSLQFNDLNQRLTVGQVNPNEISYGLAVAAGLAIIVALVNRRLGLIAGVLAALGAYAGIVLTGTRGAVVAVGVTAAWAVVALFAPKRIVRIGLWLLVGLALALAIGIFTGLSDNLMLSTTTAQVGRETGTLNGRLVLWPIARELFQQHFWFGVGPGMFQLYNPNGVYAHDALLDVANDVGAVGLVVFCFAVWATLWHETRGADSRMRYAAVGAAVASLAPTLLTGYWFQTPGCAVAFALFSSVAALAPKRSDAEECGRGPAV